MTVERLEVLDVQDGDFVSVGHVKVHDGRVMATVDDPDLERAIAATEGMDRMDAATPPNPDTNTAAERKEPAPDDFIAREIRGLIRTFGYYATDKSDWEGRQT